jgi:hypothetical protein
MRIMRWLVGGRLSRIYLAVVALATALSIWELRRWTERDAEVAGTYPMFATVPPLLLTAPASVLLEWWLMPAAWDGVWLFTVPVLVGALVNVAAVNGIRSWARRRRRSAVGPNRQG